MRNIVTILGRIGLVVAGLLAPILLLELGVRVMRLAPPPIPNPTIWDVNPELGWRHLPQSGGTFYSSFNEYRAEVKINSLGLRDDEALTGYSLPPDTFSMLILADSFGEALQVPLDKTFFKQLQHRLTQAGLKAQSINAGVGSWGTDQEATFYRLEGYRYHPDLVLLFFFVRNDAANNYGPLEIARNGGSIQKSFYRLDDEGKLVYPPPFDPDHAYSSEAAKPNPLPPAPLLPTADWLWLRSHLYRWLVPYLQDIPPVLAALGPGGLLGGEARVRAAHPVVPIPFYVYQTPPSREWRQAWALTAAILGDLNRQVTANGSRFATVIIPAKEQVYPDRWDKMVAANPSLKSATWDLNLPNRQLAQILVEQGIPYLDLLPAFKAAAAVEGGPPLYFKHDGHWTEAGHALAAEAVFEFLQQANLAGGQR
ncbi:MAG: hypothetical protein ACE5G8_05110 [Anaerolineae bacterium]